MGLKIAWLSEWDLWGNGKGYSVHNGNMRKQAERLGAELVTPEECDLAIDIIVPPNYKPVPGKFNVLFSMYEMNSLPKHWLPHIHKADAIIVPCKHNKRLFERYVNVPVDVCQEGFDPKEFPYVKREWPAFDKHFNFLWVGASNPRKGYEFVCAAWELWQRTQPADVLRKTRLIMKTTKSGDDETVKSMFNCVIDNRKLPFEELKQLYYAAHAFMLPSLGEGWGLTLHEAQASGAPCIYTPWSGPVDFMLKGAAYPVRFKMGQMKAVEAGTNRIQHQGAVAKPDVKHLVRRMEQIYNDYDTATARAARASKHLHDNYTWDHSGEILMEILARRYAEWKTRQKRSA